MSRTISALLAQYIQAIHTQNKEDFISLWSSREDNHMISIKTEFIGTENIYQKFLIDGIQERYSSIVLIGEPPVVDYLTDDIARLVFRYRTECTLRENGEPFGIEGLETQILIKENDDWKIWHVHYSK